MGPKILIVDDNQENRRSLRALLESEKYEVEEAPNGHVALDVARRGPPAAVITELSLPGMDGFTFLYEWNRSSELSASPVIVYAAFYADNQDRQLALDLGAAAYLVKPKEADELMSGIFSVLEQPIRKVRYAERSAEEKRQIEKRLALVQRMELIGRLAGGVAHDFNNLLTVILSDAEWIESGLPTDSPFRVSAKRVREAGERAAALTKQLLMFTRRRTVKPEATNLNELIVSMHEGLRRLMGSAIEVKTELFEGLDCTEIDKAQLKQVLTNLANNARDAMGAGGRLTIRTYNIDVDDENAQHLSIGKGSYVVLSVADEGVGMDEITRAHAFDPFFSTKRLGKATGLGLTTVYLMVKQNNGHISVESRAGEGTVFEIYLPRTEVPVEKPTAEIAHAATGGAETILLVDDEDMVRGLAKILLEREGYRILEASSGVEALRIAEQSGISIDLMLTDVIMPKMNGRQLAEGMLALRPSMKIGFISGYSNEILAHRGILEGGISLLEKPFSASALTAFVRRILDGATSGSDGRVGGIRS